MDVALLNEDRKIVADPAHPRRDPDKKKKKKPSLHKNSFFPSDALVRRGLRPLASADSHPALWSLHVTLKPPYPT